MILPLSKIKSILILLLAALCVYQTGVLWFVNITNRNFLFNYFPFLQQTAIPEGFESFVVPWRVFSAVSQGNFTVAYNNLARPDFDHHAGAILSQLLISGNFVNAHLLDHENMLSFIEYPAYIYEYAFPMKSEWFTLGFGQRDDLLSRHGLESFRRIIIRPPNFTELSSSAEVYFLCENGYAYEFVVTFPINNDGRIILNRTAMYSADYDEPVLYKFVSLPAGGHFIRHGEFEFFDLNVSNPYAIDGHGMFALDFVREKVAGFFSNPAAIHDIVDSDVWVYRDLNTIVRYYDSHVLEYLSFRAIDRSGTPSFINDFTAAVQFIERDNLIINDFYLAGFREEGDLHVFYFNYIIGNTPIIMPENWPRDVQLSHPIIVTVDHATVVRYHKLAFNFHLDVQPVSANVDFYNQMHRLAGGFEDIKLGYRMSNDTVLGLYWFVDGRVLSAVRGIR